MVLAFSRESRARDPFPRFYYDDLPILLYGIVIANKGMDLLVEFL